MLDLQRRRHRSALGMPPITGCSVAARILICGGRPDSAIVEGKLLRMKQIKLSGRERAVLRAIDFSTGTLGQDLLEHTGLQAEDLVDILNGLMEVGYAEVVPFSEHTSLETFATSTFEVNPSYALELREAMKR